MSDGPIDQFSPAPATLLATIAREKVTKLFAPPTVWISLLRHPDFDRTDLSSLRKGYYGAAAMPAEVLRELLRRLPDIQLWNFYGQTEMAPPGTIGEIVHRSPHATLGYYSDEAEAAVFGISHPCWIEAVTAVVVPKDGAELTADEVHAHARARLAGYKRPKYVVFCEGPPKNPSGKILKRDLRAAHAHLADDAAPGGDR